MNRAKSPTLPGFDRLAKPFRFPAQPYEYTVQALRECPTPKTMHKCSTPESAIEYWRLHVRAHPYFNPECECFVVLMLNVGLRVKGHYLVSIGTQDGTIVHPREVFRLAIMASAHAVILAHNHPSGDPTPSKDDIKVTRQLIRAGELLDLPVYEHIIIGNPTCVSLYALGYFKGRSRSHE